MRRIMETNDRYNVVENETNMVNENEYSEVIAMTEEFDEELDLVEETDLEGEVAVSKDYSLLSKKELLDELKMLVDNVPVDRIRKDVEAIQSAFAQSLHKEMEEAIDVEAGEEIDYDAPEEQEFRAYMEVYKTKRLEQIKLSDEQRKENYTNKLAIIEELKDLVNNEENIPLAFQKFHDIHSRWKEIGQVPQNMSNTLWETWHHHIEKFYDYVKINKELRQLDMKRNLEAKNQIIKKVEALLELPSIAIAHSELQACRDEWHEIGSVPREFNEELWDRFRELSSQISKKHQAFVEQIKAERAQNLTMKTALCQRIENLNKGNYTNIKEWQKASAELLTILEEWRTIGFVSKKGNSDIYMQMRKLRNEFFDTRRRFFKIKNREFLNNFKIKTELCEKAEQLKTSDDWATATAEFLELQKKWKETGPVTHKHADKLWQKFRSACDEFFKRKASMRPAVKSEFVDNLTAKMEIIAELEKLENASIDIRTVRQFQLRWNKIGYVPMKQKTRIRERFMQLLEEKSGMPLDEINRKDFKEKRPNFKPERPHYAQTETPSYSKIARLENEIARLENNVGFFANTKNAESLIADVMRKIEKAKHEIEDLKKQVTERYSTDNKTDKEEE